MKKVVLAAILISAAYVMSAQEPVIYTTTTTTTTVRSDVDYTSQVPATIRTNFQLTYPAVTEVKWMPVNDWWYATYKDDNDMIVRVYYNTQPYYLGKNESFRMALPVLNTYIPDDIIAAAINNYGNELFSITAAKPDETGQTYHVTLI
ncbi:MAG TPA: hypothetical protein VF476_08960, partial [Chitinophagaceae bacterium]